MHNMVDVAADALSAAGRCDEYPLSDDSPLKY